MADYYTILTNTGHAKVFAALSGGPALRLARIAAGDGGGSGFYDEYDRDALRQRTTLVNQQWIDDLNLVDVDPENPAWIITEGLIPTAVGGWYIREVGIFDDDGDLIAIGVYPETYKPIATAVEADLLIRSIIEVGDADSVELRIDPSQVMATRAWVVDVAIPQALTMLDEKVDEAAAHADRAEQARDIAQFAVGIFSTTAIGLNNTQSGQYFWVPSEESELLLDLYHNDSGTAVYQESSPSAEVIRRLGAEIKDFDQRITANAMQAVFPRQTYGAFDYGDSNESEKIHPVVVDERGNVSLAISRDGFPIHSVRRSFDYGDQDRYDRSTFKIITDEGYVLFDIDEHGNPVSRPTRGFNYEDGVGEINLVTEDGKILQSWDDEGRPLNITPPEPSPGDDIDFDDLPFSSEPVASGRPWNNRGSVHVKRHYPDIWSRSVRVDFPDTAAIHAYADDLSGEFPDYITKQVMGQDPWGNDVALYRCNALDYTLSGSFYPPDSVPKPKIILLGCTHGNEGHTAKCTVLLMEELCRRWNQDPRLERLRFNCDLLVVPVVSPTSYNANSRVNANHVNINRNYPTGWSSGGSSSPTSTNYRGPEEASELETQMILNLMETEPAITALVDSHRLNGVNNSPMALWYGVRGETALGNAQVAIRDTLSFLYKEFEMVPSRPVQPKARFAYSSDGTTARHGQAIGIDSYLLETPNSIYSSGSFNVYKYAMHAHIALLSTILETEETRRRLHGIVI